MTSGSSNAESKDAVDRRGGRDGFTLVEVLVAFTVLAMLAAVMQRAVVFSTKGVMRADSRISSAMVARTLLGGPVGIGAEAIAVKSGRMNGHDWRLHFEPVDAGLLGSAGADAGNWRPLRMIVEVADTNGRAPVRVESIRLVRFDP